MVTPDGISIFEGFQTWVCDDYVQQVRLDCRMWTPSLTKASPRYPRFYPDQEVRFIYVDGLEKENDKKLYVSHPVRLQYTYQNLLGASTLFHTLGTCLTLLILMIF